MNDDDIWAAIDDQRRRTTDLLEELSDDEWRRPSLCDGWTVRDVAGHLTLQQLTALAAMRLVITNPRVLGGTNRFVRESARSRAGLPTEQLIAEIRAMIGSRRHNVGVTNLETLIDILVHGQDIALPLGRDLSMSADAAAVAASRVWSTRGTRLARVFGHVPFDGMRLTADDVTWSVGDGREVRGSISAILLLLTGRLAALPRLSGDGLVELRSRLRVN
ncbi:maleylpyruvate isomerase family mycothiol-dependent enzyme [Mycobacterium sp. URHB0044]|uniref:maleylpyruvate isomerase family mycothiol-dependent enzyme n=1 Tax=Mycobacterium sp. URHB0044 TaxID=1380386 RepID=UPI0004921045|nr:maleylpyruvate isomerase family mycothiol-dependent enzyme [Mycobacterium sp. URHB0044]